MSGPGGPSDELDQALALANGAPADALSGGACANCPARGAARGGASADDGAGDRAPAHPGGRGTESVDDDMAALWLSAASRSTEGRRPADASGGPAPASADDDLAPAWLLGSADRGPEESSDEGRRPADASGGPAPASADDDLAPAWLLGSADRGPEESSDEERLSGVMRAPCRPELGESEEFGESPEFVESAPASADDGLLPEWLTRAAGSVGLNRPAAGAPAVWGPGGGGVPGERHDGRVTSHRGAVCAGSGAAADASEAPPPDGRPGREPARPGTHPAGHTVPDAGSGPDGGAPSAETAAGAAAGAGTCGPGGAAQRPEHGLLPGWMAQTAPIGRRTPVPSHVTWEEAQRVAARAAAPGEAATVPLDRTARQVLAAPLEALADLPSFDTAAMDGWAVAGPGPWVPADPSAGPGVLAGHTAPEPLADGCAVRIATGARMPDGATAVLRSERAELRDGRLRPAADAPARGTEHGTDVRPRGQECRAGDRLLPAGTPVTPPVLGLAAAAGYDRLAVTPRPRAEVLVLGDELLHAGLPSEGRIRDALGPMVGPWLTALGAEVLVTRRLGDDAEALHEVVTTSTADLLVTTGGTAHGPVDHVRPTLYRIGARLLVDGVEVRPGHPMLLAALAGTQQGRHLVGLPGNPLAAVSGLLTLAAPLLRARAGLPEPEPVRATLTAEVPGHPRDTRLVPVTRSADGSGATPLRWTGPAMLRGIAGAAALAAVPPGGAAAGTSVRLLVLPW